MGTIMSYVKIGLDFPLYESKDGLNDQVSLNLVRFSMSLRKNLTDYIEREFLLNGCNEKLNFQNTSKINQINALKTCSTNGRDISVIPYIKFFLKDSKTDINFTPKNLFMFAPVKNYSTQS